MFRKLSLIITLFCVIIYSCKKENAPLTTVNTVTNQPPTSVYPGTWKRLANFTTEGLTTSAAGFAINNTGYIMFPNGDLWQYNVSNDTWSRKNRFTPATVNNTEVPHILFSVNNIAYLYFEGIIWKYDDKTDSWLNILKSSSATTGPGTAFVLNNKAYILQYSEVNTPTSGSISKVFDPVSNTINTINLTSANSVTGFATDKHIYIAGEQPYMFDPDNNSNTRLASTSPDVGALATRYGGVSFTINGIAYIGEGYRHDDYYAYSEKNTSVQRMAIQSYTDPNFSADRVNVGARNNGASFVINGKSYVGFGEGRTDFWEFTP